MLAYLTRIFFVWQVLQYFIWPLLVIQGRNSQYYLDPILLLSQLKRSFMLHIRILVFTKKFRKDITDVVKYLRKKYPAHFEWDGFS